MREIKYRDGVLQLPVIPFEGKGKPGEHTRKPPPLGWHTGIRCPRCQMREIIYNGNYFCSGYGDLWSGGPMDCEWALPSDEDDLGDEPHHVLLGEALVASQMRRSS